VLRFEGIVLAEAESMTGRSRGSTGRVACAAVWALCVGLWATPLAAWEWFPERALLPTLIAGARDPATQSQLVQADPNPTDYGPGVAGEVAISSAATVARIAGDTADALVVGIEAAAFARFSLQVVTRELVHTDWVFAVPLVRHRGPHWWRLRYYHTSSHMGDEAQRRFGPSSINFSRDGADITGYLSPVSGVGLYGLVFLSVNSHPEERRLWEWRAGAEIDTHEGATWQPFAAADLHVEQGTDWDPRLTLRAGLWLPRVQARPFRLVAEFLTGPSPMGQFRTRSTRHLALGLHWNP
jgi:hypothetical protein